MHHEKDNLIDVQQSVFDVLSGFPQINVHKQPVWSCHVASEGLGEKIFGRDPRQYGRYIKAMDSLVRNLQVKDVQLNVEDQK